MRYHFIIDGYSGEMLKQMEEQNAFKEQFLAEDEEGESYILCRSSADITGLAKHLGENAILLTGSDYSPEAVLLELEKKAAGRELYIFGSGYAGTELAVRLAKRTGGSSVTAVHGIRTGESVTVKKMVYSNHMEGEFCMETGPFCISLAKGMEQKELDEGIFHIIEELPCHDAKGFIVSRETYPEAAGCGIEASKLVIAAGRGVRKKENIKYLEDAAKTLGGELGVSRPAAMNAWAPMQKLIGVSGAMIKPDICITAGVSGAAAFYAGIEKSKFIVAINTDEKAPIMKKADVAVADDFEPVMRELTKLASE